MSAPLEGLKILDFTYLLPGPLGTMMLADLGADIIKVENPFNPDLMRLVPPHVGAMSSVYAHVNRGKRSLALDLRRKESLEIIYELVREYDIVVEQFRPGVMGRLGFGYEALRERNSRLIYCSLTGYGQSGSYSMRAGHDINYMALSGIESFSGRKDSGPSLHGIQFADIAGGSKSLVIAVMAAAMRRERTGEGDYCDISITDCLFALSAFDTAGFLAGADLPSAETGILNGGSLYDYYRTSDGRYLSVGVIEPKFLIAFMEAIGMADELGDGLLDSSQVDGLKRRIAERIASRPFSHWMNVFKDIDACVEPVIDLSEALGSPPLSERDIIVTVHDEQGAEYRQIGNPLKFASGNYVSEQAGSAPGRHNREILVELGYDDDKINSLYSLKVM